MEEKRRWRDGGLRRGNQPGSASEKPSACTGTPTVPSSIRLCLLFSQRGLLGSDTPRGREVKGKLSRQWEGEGQGELS